MRRKNNEIKLDLFKFLYEESKNTTITPIGIAYMVLDVWYIFNNGSPFETEKRTYDIFCEGRINNKRNNNGN